MTRLEKTLGWAKAFHLYSTDLGNHSISFRVEMITMEEASILRVDGEMEADHLGYFCNAWG